MEDYYDLMVKLMGEKNFFRATASEEHEVLTEKTNFNDIADTVLFADDMEEGRAAIGYTSYTMNANVHNIRPTSFEYKNLDEFNARRGTEFKTKREFWDAYCDFVNGESEEYLDAFEPVEYETIDYCYLDKIKIVA